MSREAELYKDKIEVSLDGRQIFYLFFGGAVIVGLVFVLGVMVGRRVEARGHTERARVAATVDPLAALDRLEGGSGLSFQGALRGAESPVSDVEKEIAALPKRDDAKAEKPEPKKADEAKRVDDEAKKAEPATKDDTAAEKKSEKADAAKAEQNAAPKAETKAEPKAEKKEAAAAEKPAEKKEPAKVEKKAKYTLQLSSFQDRGEALALFDSIKAAGYQPYLTEGSVDGKQYFRVRLGSYTSMDDASRARAELEKSGKQTSIIIKL